MEDKAHSIKEYALIHGLLESEIKPLPQEYQPKGKVRYYGTVEGQIITCNGGFHAMSMKQNRESNGYLRVCFTIGGKRLYKRVHRIIAELFIDNPDSKYYVHHRDCNRYNNRADNLQWVTWEEHIEIHNQLRKQEKEANSGVQEQ